ncbi:putative signal transducing protein [Flavobacterium pallidum]|uniref:DUF2007 domain-containing protein n=1 Tax=Flavobacterium pallidum TaxID=2172098 RepID=A0A2S1SI53_9FLAO|nr:DUF2007 domain-containing protein [Flavobacterium pallidum]AWI26022.1 hypothetical protein HYN49_08995 [Flavobacterium pallidum]
MALLRVFEGGAILALRLKEMIESEGVSVIVKDDIQSAIWGGYGTSDLAVELYIHEDDYGFVADTIDEFNNSLDT